jgi:hypothetical protein
MYETNKTWRKLINELMDKNIFFDIVNNVLTFKGLPKDCQGLWLHFNEIRIAEQYGEKAGDMLILEDYKINNNDEIIFYTRGQ